MNKKLDNEIKDVFIKARVSKGNKELINEIAVERGKTLSKYILDLIEQDIVAQQSASILFNGSINETVKFQTIVGDFIQELVDSQNDMIKSQEMENIDYFGLELMEYLLDKFHSDNSFQREIAEVYINTYKKYFDRFYKDK